MPSQVVEYAYPHDHSRSDPVLDLWGVGSRVYPTHTHPLSVVVVERKFATFFDLFVQDFDYKVFKIHAFDELVCQKY